jgi:hypothetical protein
MTSAKVWFNFLPRTQENRSVFSVPTFDSQTTKILSLTERMKLSIAALVITSATAFSPSSFSGRNVGHSPAASSALCMKYKVAVVGGGPSGACAAEIFAQEKGIDTVLFERKLDNAKPCGGAIPLCMVGEFNLPESVVDRKVRSLFPSNNLCTEDRDAGSLANSRVDVLAMERIA